LIDNNYIASLPSPFHFAFTPSNFGLQAGTHTIIFNATNSVYAKSTAQQTVTLQ